jgi:hypothetical protein
MASRRVSRVALVIVALLVIAFIVLLIIPQLSGPHVVAGPPLGP